MSVAQDNEPLVNDTVLYREDGAIGIITLNRPKQMNAANKDLRAALSEALDRAENSANVRIVILTGEGRGFSAGADLSEGMQKEHATISQHILKDYKPLVDAISRSDKAYIAALNGATAGVMMAVALSCDLIIMARSAYIYSPFTAISLVPDGGATWFMLRAFGYQRAFEMIAEGRKMSAQECFDAGLANAVEDDDALQEKVLDRARGLSMQAPLSLKYAKKLLRAAHYGSREEITALEADFQYILSQSADFPEGIAAFMGKRKPNFQGK
ncbi:MAG: enoyl-CoA hydratase/isomerase family protein [Pseudomonadota bacterium]